MRMPRVQELRSSTALYVCEPNYNSVKKITKRMKKVMKETKENESSASDKNDVIK